MNLKKMSYYFTVLFIIISFMSVYGGQMRVSGKKPVLKVIVNTELQSPAKHYEGFCPAKVKMTGKIDATGPVILKYQFLRSDGVKSRLITLNFTGRGSKTIPFNWEINKDYQGWVQLIVKLPKKEIKSNKFYFDVKCDKKRANTKPPIRIGEVRILNNSPALQITDYKLKSLKVSDLIIKNIIIQPTAQVREKDVNFTIIVKNISNLREKQSPPCFLKFYFTYYHDQTQQHLLTEECPLPSIPSGGEITLKYVYKFDAGNKWFRINILVDSKLQVKEINENNNFMFEKFYIDSGQAPQLPE